LLLAEDARFVCIRLKPLVEMENATWIPALVDECSSLSGYLWSLKYLND
jgi:hypothetical protein